MQLPSANPATNLSGSVVVTHFTFTGPHQYLALSECGRDWMPVPQLGSRRFLRLTSAQRALSSGFPVSMMGSGGDVGVGSVLGADMDLGRVSRIGDGADIDASTSAERDGGTELPIVDMEAGDEGEGEGKEEKPDKDGIGKKKPAEMWQDAEMDALVSAYHQVHMKVAMAGKQGKHVKHVFKSANEKWKEVQNLLHTYGVDRQAKEIERKWSNLSTAYKKISDWNKKVGQPNYWELDEVTKREKTKAKELPATFRVQLFESMSEVLGDRTVSRKCRTWDPYSRPASAGASGSNEAVIDVLFPTGKLSYPPPTTDAQEQRRPRAVLVSTGSFNPPTYMHLHMFELARDELMMNGYDVLGGYMSPVNDAYGKKGLALADDRIKMCQLATDDSPLIMVDAWEATQATTQRSLTVLSRIEQTVNNLGLPNNDKIKILLLCGSDLLESFNTPGIWIPEQVQTICQEFGIVCVSKLGNDARRIVFENDILYRNKRNVFIVDDPVTNDISSTKVRRLFGRGLSVKYLTSDCVINYMKMNHLYGYTLP